jgi:hypothetical protein
MILWRGERSEVDTVLGTVLGFLFTYVSFNMGIAGARYIHYFFTDCTHKHSTKLSKPSLK